MVMISTVIAADATPLIFRKGITLFTRFTIDDCIFWS
jgi:hypothetical protein